MVRTFTPSRARAKEDFDIRPQTHNKHLAGTVLCVVQCAGTVVWMVRVFGKNKAFVSISLITVKMEP